MPILRECRRIMSSNRDSVRFPVTPPNLYTYTSFASRATLSARGKTWRLNNWSSAYLSPLGEGRADQQEFPPVKLDAHFPVGVEQAVPVHAEEAGIIGRPEFLPLHGPAVRDAAVLSAEDPEAVQVADIVADDDVRPFPRGHLNHGFHAVREQGRRPRPRTSRIHPLPRPCRRSARRLHPHCPG